MNRPNFSRVCADITADKRVSHLDHRVFAAIALFGDQAGVAWPSLTEIATASGTYKSGVSNAIKRLVDLGYIQRSGRKFYLQSLDKRYCDSNKRYDDSNEVDTQTVTTSVTPVTTTVTPVTMTVTPSKQTNNKPITDQYPPIVPPSPKSENQSKLFDEFWSQYPRRVGKGAARQKFIKALGLADFGTIMVGVAKLSSSVANQDPKFTPHPATWLSQERWTDEPDPKFERRANQNGRTIDDIARGAEKFLGTSGQAGV